MKLNYVHFLPEALFARIVLYAFKIFVNSLSRAEEKEDFFGRKAACAHGPTVFCVTLSAMA